MAQSADLRRRRKFAREKKFHTYSARRKIRFLRNYLYDGQSQIIERIKTNTLAYSVLLLDAPDLLENDFERETEDEVLARQNRRAGEGGLEAWNNLYRDIFDSANVLKAELAQFARISRVRGNFVCYRDLQGPGKFRPVRKDLQGPGEFRVLHGLSFICTPFFT